MEKLKKHRPCGECGADTINEVNLKNTWVNEPWKDFPKVYISCDLMQLQCSECGSFSGTRKTAQAFDEAVKQSISEQVSRFIEHIKKRSRLSLKTIAERIPMGYQHLSDLKNGRSFPSYHYWSLLSRISKFPELLDQLDSSKDQDPPMSMFG